MDLSYRQHLLERGLSFHRDGRFADALTFYRDVLNAVPRDPEARRLAADAYFSDGDFAAAAAHFQILANNDPSDAQTRFNLGVSHRQAGNTPDAIRAFESALKIDPFYPKGWFNLGVVLDNVGRVAEAAAAFEKAVDAEPDDPAAMANLAACYAKNRAFNKALKLFDKAIGRWPQIADIRLMLAAALRKIQAYGRAEEACRVAVSLAPDNPDAHAALGLTLALAGKHADAVAAIRAALALEPGRVASNLALAGSLAELGECDEALEICELVLADDPDNKTALYNKARTLMGLARPAAAVDVYRAALAIAPGDANILKSCAEALNQAGSDAEIGELYGAAIKAQPNAPFPYAGLAGWQLGAGNAAPALEIASEAVARFPGDTASLALQAVAATAAGATEIAETLLDFDRLTARINVAAPTGWESVAAFNTALAEHVRNHPSIEYAPSEHATREGYHTGELLLDPMGPIAGLEELIRSAVDDYRRNHPRDPGHPFLARHPDRFGLNIWAIILKAAGHQIPHIHSTAWLSGVYYPKLPPVIGDNSRAGWIEFGQFPEHIACGAAPEIVSVRPEEGLMLLFPSYMYHRTIPFAGDGTRISIAFDISLVG